jgi:hypothetical protein
MEERDTLLNLQPKTCQEKLLWANHHVSELERDLKKANLEKGILKSELEELKHHMKTSEIGALVIKNKKHKEAKTIHINPWHSESHQIKTLP